ncbi:MAG: TetR family transcriptional regulator [Chitinispirillaceae bacterium]|nr:TetR family transcriptional regulator [Chitinispirillaceae bacterium]
MRRTKEDTEISKLRILMAAEAEFCQRGFVAANMDAIARAAGMTKGAIFWHYESKIGLFKAILKRATSRIKDIFRETFSASETGLVLEKCREVFKRVKKDNAFDVLLVLSDSDKNANIPKDVLAECRKDIAGILNEAGRILTAAKKSGELRNDTDIQNVLITMILIMSGFAKIKEFRSLIDPIGRSIDDESVINTIFNGLLSFQKRES